MKSASHSLTPTQPILLGILRAGNPRRHRNRAPTHSEFVLECGCSYEPSLLPKCVKAGRTNQSFKVALGLVVDESWKESHVLLI